MRGYVKYKGHYMTRNLLKTPEYSSFQNHIQLLLRKSGILLQKGIQQHTCEILEGGEEAFLKREQKYNFKQQ